MKHFSRHHRKPRSLGGTNTDRNMSPVSTSKHQAWHIMFGNMNPYKIAKAINETWLDPDYNFVVHRKGN